MTSNELTLDQLTAIAGGVQMGRNGETCTDRFTRKSIQDNFGEGKMVIHPEFRILGSPDTGGDDI